MVIINIVAIYLRKYGDIMVINLKYIKNELEKLNALIDVYEENSLNIKNSLKSVSFFWIGELEHKFINEVNDKMKKLDLNLIDLESTKDIYNYIINQYSNIGNRIEYNNSIKIKVFEYLDITITEYDNLLQKYNEINYSLDGQLTPIIEQERISLINNKKYLENYTSSIKTMYNRLDEIEKNINQKIYKLTSEMTEL